MDNKINPIYLQQINGYEPARETTENAKAQEQEGIFETTCEDELLDVDFLPQEQEAPQTMGDAAAPDVSALNEQTNYQISVLEEAGMIKHPPQKEGFVSLPLSDSYMNEINRLYYNCLQINKSIKDEFVPSFATRDEAANTLPTGEVCQIEGNQYISIKSADGTMHDLNISADTFLTLFPPGDRFNVEQAQAGDCYLLTSLDYLQKDPATREALYKCFSEDGMGNVSVQIPTMPEYVNHIRQEDNYSQATFTMPINGDVRDYVTDSYYKKNSETTNANGETYTAYTPTTVNEYSSLISNSCPGIQMLEHVYGLQLAAEQTGDLVDNLNKQNLEFSAIQDPSSVGVTFSGDDVDGVVLYESFAESLRGNGGSTNQVLTRFLDTTPENEKRQIVGTWTSDPNAIDFILNKYMEPDSHMLLTTGTKGTSDAKFVEGYEDRQIAQSHAYQLYPFTDTDGVVKFKLINPWETSKQVILSKDELTECTKGVYFFGDMQTFRDAYYIEHPEQKK